MDTGDPNNETSPALPIKDQFSTLSVDDDDNKSSVPEKDPTQTSSTNSLQSSTSEAKSRRELHQMVVPSVLRESWVESESGVRLNFYYVKLNPRPDDRVYKEFGLFLKASLPAEAERMKVDLHLDGGGGRIVEAELVPSGVADFDNDEIQQAQKYHQMWLKAILDREAFIPDFVSLENNDLSNSSSSTFYLLLPVTVDESNRKVDWELLRRCLSSPIFRTPDDAGDHASPHSDDHLQLANGPESIDDVKNSLVYAPSRKIFYFVAEVIPGKIWALKVKELFKLKNLLCKRGNPESRRKEEQFINLQPENCQLKIIGFSKEIGSTLSLLPSFMHRLESLLVAIELKQVFSSSFAEGAKVTAYSVLKALTTENCNEGFSYERFEVLGDAFLKFAVSRHLFFSHSKLEKGQLTNKRKDIVENSNLFKLAKKRNIQVYIRDQIFDPCQFFALGHPCSVICSEETETTTRSPCKNGANTEVRFNKNHRWLQKETIEDVVEALIGAFIVDSGFKAATAFLKWIGIQVDFQEWQINNICSASRKFMKFAARTDIPALEKFSGPFLHKGLLVEAFVHPSCRVQVGGCYMRLKFLGDAVLDYLVMSYLYSKYTELNPGHLTALRSEIVNNKFLGDIARHHSMHDKVICNSDDLKERVLVKPLGALVESFIAAICLDTGFNLNHVWEIMLSLLNLDTNLSRLKVEGCIPKPKSFEKVLKSSCEMEAKLIGFDETPINIIASDAAEFDSVKPLSTGCSDKGTAESHLYKICTEKCWKLPLFEYHMQIGPDHLHEAVVTVEALDMILECHGEPRAKQEEAKEHAAEGVLWYLKHEGTCLGKEGSI